MLTIEKLRAYGANVEEGMGRCMNNEMFYLRLVNMAADDGGFEKLRAAMESGDRKESFEAAHALKGMLGNLALTPVAKPASELTEMLRAGWLEGARRDYADLERTYKEVCEKIRSVHI